MPFLFLFFFFSKREISKNVFLRLTTRLLAETLLVFIPWQANYTNASLAIYVYNI